jgi:hypothetical protein
MTFCDTRFPIIPSKAYLDVVYVHSSKTPYIIFAT